MDAPRLDVLRDERAGAEEALRADCDLMADVRANANEAVGLDDGVTRDHSVSCDVAMVAHRRVMADVVRAPDEHVITDPRPGLDDGELEHEAVVADRNLADVRR